MPTTPLGFQYPSLTDGPNGPSQIQALAASVDSYLTGKAVRVGARATTNVAQAYSASTGTLANNNGTAAWTATEDSGGFVSNTGGTTTPIIIQVDGLYLFGFGASTNATSTTKGTAAIFINGSIGNGTLAVFTGNSGCGGLFVAPLTGGTTLGLQIFNNVAGNIVAGNQIYAYRIGD